MVQTTIGPVSDDHRIGSLFVINGEQLISEVDSGTTDDIVMPPNLGESLGLVENSPWRPTLSHYPLIFRKVNA